MYLEYYQLRKEPFRLTPDPTFLHLAQPYSDALDALVQCILRRRGLMVLSGPIGTGKTTLLHAAMQILMSSKDSKTSLATAFVFNPLLSREEFLETLLIEFEIPSTSPSKPARLAALHKMFLQKQRQGGTTVLIVDEAHLLTPELLEEIRLLSNTDTYQEKLLQVVLCGQPELSMLLQRAEMRALQQRITQYCSLRPLTLPETRGYIAERMHAAGLRGPSPFSSKSIEYVHRYSDGVPRRINQICDGALFLGFATQRNAIQPDMVEAAAQQLQLEDSATRPPRTRVERADDGHKSPEATEPLKPKPAVKAAEAASGSNGADAVAVRSAVDLIIEALKHRRANALE
jgi:general secretion pathway protein A